MIPLNLSTVHTFIPLPSKFIANTIDLVFMLHSSLVTVLSPQLQERMWKSVVSDSLQPHGLYSPWNSPGQDTGVVAVLFSRGSSQWRDWTQVSHIPGRFFTSWATREAQEYWSGYPISSPADLPDPGIELGSPALQVNSLPAEPPGKPSYKSDPFKTGWDHLPPGIKSFMALIYSKGKILIMAHMSWQPPPPFLI